MAEPAAPDFKRRPMYGAWTDRTWPILLALFLLLFGVAILYVFNVVSLD